ncbi:TonB-dependent receptor [Novosphingobium sp.]|uniref:TonB-dependent receptor plug domain-containing protein n=1 Tax=Novosphingobium sp. TaxID=1874826 RepID=UPI0025E03062|nr:TonB-dependent receptor [Novosphingobium sp.]MCC6927224.1 TonB-dependent receptor [Novosphingobium sp.]
MKSYSMLKASVAPVALGLTLVASPAFAQDAGQPAEDEAPAKDIVVTGSRISNPNLTAVSPVTVVNAAEVKAQGNTRVEDMLNSLPQVFAADGSTDANGATGTATVNLRNLGTNRTLVLVNGRRLGAGDPTDPAADLNFIPGAMIQRVDVLTGGASATYGSDALAGVVNFVLNTDFEGFQLDAQYSFYNHNNDFENANYSAALAARNYQPPKGNRADGATKQVNLTIGAGFDDGRGHVVAYAGWRKVNAITQGDRDFSYCAYTASSSGSCGGSSTSAVGRFRRTVNVGAGSQPVYSPTGSSYTTDPGNPSGFRTYSSARDGFNYNPYNYFQRPDERFTLGAFANYEINEHFKPYLEVMFMDDHTRAQIAPSGAFFGTDFFINCDNALMGAAQQTALCGANAGTPTIQSVYIGRRNVEGGGRVDDLRHTDYRIVAGMKGDIDDVWSYDLYGQYWRAILAERYENDFSRRRINNALNVVIDPSSGQPVCASYLNGSDRSCVPWNIWTPGGVTQAAVNYLQTPGFRSGQSTQYVASASLSGDLGKYGLKSPMAESGMQVALGFEYRKERTELTNDLAFSTGDLAGQGTPNGVRDIDGTSDVSEAFIEVALPLVEGQPGIETLGFTGGYRYSDYSLAGKTDTYKLQLEYAPVKEARFRASYNRAVRAPNNLELFSSPNITLWGGRDPCAGAAPTATLAACQLSGVTPAQYGFIDTNPANQYDQQVSGNLNLKPEIADTLTLGVVLNPLPNLSLTVDWYNIKIKQLISTYGANFILTQCVGGNTSFCSLVHRGGGGSLWYGGGYVENHTRNLGSVKTSGIDVTGYYKMDLGENSSLTFDLVGTYLNKYDVTRIVGGSTVSCAGMFGDNCGNPLPKWRHKLRMTWANKSGFSVSAAWRYFNSSENDDKSIYVPEVHHLPAVSYFDLSLSARIADHYTFRLGAQNLFDKTPPFLDGNFSNNGSNTYAQVYDSLGRYVYASIQLSF